MPGGARDVAVTPHRNATFAAVAARAQAA